MRRRLTLQRPTERPILDTASGDYTERLVHEQNVWWKRLLDVQRPYRWNLTRLHPGRTLDVGCGVGRNLLHLPDGVGVDHNPDSVALARSRGLRAWTTDEWPTCPDAIPASFDTLLLAHVLEHLDEATADLALADYVAYLKPVAKLILICPQERGFANDVSHVRWVDSSVLDRTARSIGFEPVRAYSFPFPRFAGRFFAYNEFVLVAERRPD